MKPITYGKYGHAQATLRSYHNVLLAIALSIFKNITPEAIGTMCSCEIQFVCTFTYLQKLTICNFL